MAKLIRGDSRPLVVPSKLYRCGGTWGEAMLFKEELQTGRPIHSFLERFSKVIARTGTTPSFAEASVGLPPSGHLPLGSISLYTFLNHFKSVINSAFSIN